MALTQQEQDELELLQLEEEEHQHLQAQTAPLEKPLDLANLPNRSEFPQMVGAAGLGATQGATLGFADEIEGAARAMISGAPVDLANQSNNPELGESYRAFRDLARQRNFEAQQKYGGSYLLGEVGGGLATLAVPGVGAANMSGRGALTLGAGMGGAAGLGGSTAELTQFDPEQYKEALGDVALGAGIGGTLGAAGYGLTKALPEVAEGLRGQFQAGKRVSTEGRTILGEEAGNRINKEIIEASKLVTDTGENLQKKLGSNLSDARKAVKASDQGKYTEFLDGSLKKIDDFIVSKKGSTLEDFPELKKMRDHLDRLRFGTEVEKEIPFTEIKKLPGKPSTIKKLEAEAAKLSEQAKLQGDDSVFQVIETTGEDGKKYANLVKRTREIEQAAPEKLTKALDANGEPVFDEAGNMALDLEKTGIPSIKDGLRVKTLLSEPEIAPIEQINQGVNKVKERIAPNLTPSGEDVAGTVQDLRGLTENVLNKENLASAKDIAAGVRTGSKEFMENLSPEIAQTNKQYRDLMELDRTFGSVVGSGEKGLVGATKEGDYLKDSKQIRNFLENLNKETQGGRRSAELMGEELEPKVLNYTKQLRELAANAKTPEEAAELSLNADNLEKFLSKGKMASEDFAARESMKSTGLMGIPSLVLKYGAYGAGKSTIGRGLLKGSEKAIEALPQTTTNFLMPEKKPEPKPANPEVKPNTSPTAKTTQNLYQMSDSDLVASADAIQSVRPEIADRLRTAIENNDQPKKKAMQFVIAQDPKLRSLFNA
jgi:hypothetical protein